MSNCLSYYVVVPEIFRYFNCSVVQLVATVENVVKCVEMIIARIDEVSKCLENNYVSYITFRCSFPKEIHVGRYKSVFEIRLLIQILI